MESWGGGAANEGEGGRVAIWESEALSNDNDTPHRFARSLRVAVGGRALRARHVVGVCQ